MGIQGRWLRRLIQYLKNCQSTPTCALPPRCHNVLKTFLKNSLFHLGQLCCTAGPLQATGAHCIEGLLSSLVLSCGRMCGVLVYYLIKKVQGFEGYPQWTVASLTYKFTTIKLTPSRHFFRVCGQRKKEVFNQDMILYFMILYWAPAFCI